MRHSGNRYGVPVIRRGDVVPGQKKVAEHPMQGREHKIDNALIGAAGVHWVVSELSRRGLVALPTIRNTSAIDVLVTNPAGSFHANLQVKTSQNRTSFWLIGKRYKNWLGRNNFYVFVRYLEKESRFEAFLETAGRVAKETDPEWVPAWYLPKKEAERKRVSRQWMRFGQR